MEKYLIVGLGNPNHRFVNTRHNLGINIVRAWFNQESKQSIQANDWQIKSKYHASIAALTLDGLHITCLFPLTYMNKSGLAVASFTQSRWLGLKSGFPTKNILIIHDDTELSLGDHTIKASGSAKGHNGVKSIHQALGTQDITRLLIGIGQPKTMPLEKYVLSKFSPAEQQIIEQNTPRILKSITNIVTTKKSD